MLLKINNSPSSKELRQFGYTLLIGFELLGGFVYWRGKIHLALGFWVAGVLLGTFAILIPSSAKGLYKIWMGWALIMGTIVTRTILAVIFFGVITPVAILFRLVGRDALKLKKGIGVSTYWSNLYKISDRSYYNRLF